MFHNRVKIKKNLKTYNHVRIFKKKFLKDDQQYPPSQYIEWVRKTAKYSETTILLLIINWARRMMFLGYLASSHALIRFQSRENSAHCASSTPP